MTNDAQRFIPRRIRPMLAALTLVAGALLPVAAFPAPAQANCVDEGWPAYSYLYTNPPSGGNLRMWEYVQYSSTCDGDEIYKGKVQDALTDGYCAYVIYSTAGGDIVSGYDCSTQGSVYNFTFWGVSSYNPWYLCRQNTSSTNSSICTNEVNVGF